jgi:CRP-like cAMP-binding protein
MNEIDDVIEELQHIPWFQELKPAHVRRLASITQFATKADECSSRGDKEDFVYIVIDGRIGLDIYSHRVRFYTADRWEIFGWSSVTPNVRQRTAAAVAVIDSRVARIDAVEMRQMCEDDNELGYRVMRRLANVVAGRLLVTRLQLLDMFAHPEAKNGG